MITKIKWTNVEKLSAIEARSNRLGTCGFFESFAAASFVSASPSVEAELEEDVLDGFGLDEGALDFAEDAFSSAAISGAEASITASAVAPSSSSGFARGVRVRLVADSLRALFDGDFEPLDCDLALGDDFLSPALRPGLASGRMSKPEPLSAAKFSPMKAPLPVSPANRSVEIALRGN
jgi:hypothetical protein